MQESRPRSPLAPLAARAFLAVWIAAMASNIGTQVQSVGEKWQMAHLSSSPLLVALIETGSTLPVLGLGLVAGALADILDRRKLLLATQVFMLAVAGTLAVFTFMGQVTPGLLLGMSLLIGIGSALSMPAFQAIVPELLPRRDLGAGVALNSAGFNVSRALGPALGGTVVALMGPGWAFLLNAISFLAVVAVLFRWKRRVPTRDLPSERFLGAMKTGFRYVRHSRALQVILLRAVGYTWFAGVIFSLLPALAVHHLRLGPGAFGLMMGCVGAGAVSITVFMPRLRNRYSANQLLGGFTLLSVLAQLTIALVPHTPTVAACLFLTGMGWLATLSTINTAIQLSVPSWVKARAFGAYQMAWGGSMALGAAFWGAVAQRLGIPWAFGLSGAGLALAWVLIGRTRILVFEEEIDLRPHGEPPVHSDLIPLEAGPILIELEYRIPGEAREAFLEAMEELRQLRLRDGAIRWALFQIPEPLPDGATAFVETYLSSSMGEHLRQHHRATRADREIVARAFRFDPRGRPQVRHLLAVNEDSPSLVQRLWTTH
nr:MFS transporter [uncultured Holophaga sp.]